LGLGDRVEQKVRPQWLTKSCRFEDERPWKVRGNATEIETPVPFLQGKRWTKVGIKRILKRLCHETGAHMIPNVPHELGDI